MSQRLLNALFLLHYLLPVGVGASLLLAQSRYTPPPSLPGALLFLSAIGAAYTVDRLLDPRVRSERPRWLCTTLLAIAAGCGGVFLAFWPRLSRSGVTATLCLSAICIGYHWIRRIPLMKAPLIGLAWSWATVTLAYAENRGWSPLALPLFLLFTSGAILCDLKDVDLDRCHGTKTLPVLLGPERSRMVAAGLALMALPVSPVEFFPTAIALAILAQFPRLLSRAAVGPMLVDALYLFPGLISLLR